MHIPRSELRGILEDMYAEDETISEDIADWDWDIVDDFVCEYLRKCTTESREEIYYEACECAMPDLFSCYILKEIKIIKNHVHDYLMPSLEIPINELLTEIKYNIATHEEADHHVYKSHV